MSQQVVRDFRENELLRHGFDALAQQVFGISFEAWYRQGYWTDRYRPYLLVQDGLPVACKTCGGEAGCAAVSRSAP